MKVVIIEDEKPTARDLKRTLLALDPDMEVTTLLHSVGEALAYFRSHQEPDLIFSDIQLGDGLCFDLFRKLNTGVPVIFCTAYDAYLQEAFQVSGIDYILKPYSKASLEKTLWKYQALKNRFAGRRDDFRSGTGIEESRLYPSKHAVIVHQRNKIIPLEVSAIALFYIESGYTYAYTFVQEKFLMNETLEELEHHLAPSFFRANRQFLISRKAVKDATHFFNRKILVNLTIPFKPQILIGKLKATSFIHWLTR